MKLIKKLIVSAFWENEGVDPEDGLDTEGVVGCEVFLRLGFPQGIFEVVPDPEVFADDDATFGLGIFDGCDLLGILGDVTFALLNRCFSRNNKHFFSHFSLKKKT